MNPPGPGGPEATAESSCIFRVPACGKCGRLFMPHLNESDFVLVSSECLENAVNAIAGQSKNRIYTPINKPSNQQISNGSCHHNSSHIFRKNPLGVWHLQSGRVVGGM